MALWLNLFDIMSYESANYIIVISITNMLSAFKQKIFGKLSIKTHARTYQSKIIISHSVLEEKFHKEKYQSY